MGARWTVTLRPRLHLLGIAMGQHKRNTDEISPARQRRCRQNSTDVCNSRALALYSKTWGSKVSASTATCQGHECKHCSRIVPANSH